MSEPTYVLNRKEAARLLPNKDKSMCFACSAGNEHGLQLEFRAQGQSVFFQGKLPAQFSGWSNLVHGGIISTIFDEIMARAVMYYLKSLCMTISMTVDFLRPVFIGADVLVEGRVAERHERGKVITEGFLYNGTGDLCVRAQGTFILSTPEILMKRGVIDQNVIEWFNSLVKGTEEANS